MSRELPLRTPKVLGCWDPGSGFVPSAGDNRAGARPPGSRCGTAPRPATRSSWTRRGGRTQVSPRSGELRTLGAAPRPEQRYSILRAGLPALAAAGTRVPKASAILAAQSTRIRWAWSDSKPRPRTVRLPGTRHTLLISRRKRQRVPRGPYLRPMDQSPRSHAHCYPFLKP